MITPIEQLRSISGEAHGMPSLERTYLGEQSIFGAIFQPAIRNVKETNADAVEAQYLLATGQLDNPAALQIAQEKEGMALELLIQLRSKALEVYSELNRINL